MSGKRTKTDKINIKKIIIIVALLIIILASVAIAIIKISKQDRNNSNSIIENTTAIETGERPQIRAYFEDTKASEEVKDGAIFNENISIYWRNSELESITHNGNPYEGTKLNDEGTYIITIKPNDGTNNITKTVTIDTEVPKLEINNEDIIQGKHYKIGAILTLKDKKGINKIEKAVLVSCNGNYEIDKEKEPIDITQELKQDGYTFNQKGLYKIQLLDKNNNQLEFSVKDVGFRIRE